MCVALRANLSIARRCCRFTSLRRLSDIDFSKEKPTAWQLEHVQTRLIETTPDFFRTRVDYTFYHRDVHVDDQITGKKLNSRDDLMRHFGLISVVVKLLAPHVEMECIDCYPQLEDGSVRLRWRVKYVSWLRVIFNPMLVRYEYRLKNLSWFDGYCVFDVDGNGDVYKLSIQRMRRDESYLLKGAENLKKTLKEVVAPKPAGSVNTSNEEVKKQQPR